MRQNRMPKRRFALISRRIWHCIGTRYPGLSIGSPWRSYLDLPANVLAATMEKDEALTRLLKLKIRRQHYCHARSQSLRNFAFSKSWTTINYPWQRRAYSQADEQLREFIESAQIPFCQCLWRKGSWKIRIHFLRQLAFVCPGKCWRCHACWCSTEWLLAHGKKGWAADTQFIQLELNRRKLTATVPLLCQSLAIFIQYARYAGRIETKHIYDSAVWRDILNIHKQQNAQKMHEK